MRMLMFFGTLMLFLTPSFLGVTGASGAACSERNDLPVIGGVELSDPDDLIERNVISADGRWVGTVEDIVLNRCRTPASIIVSMGGGEGSKLVAIAIDRVRFQSNGGSQPDGGALRIDGMTRAEIIALPPVEDAGAAATSLNHR